MVWYAMVYNSIVWYGMVWYYGMVLYSTYGKIQAASCEKTALSFGENFRWTEIQ